MPNDVTFACTVCTKSKASYKCPKCRSVYCSMQCNKIHKSSCPSKPRIDSERISDKVVRSNDSLDVGVILCAPSMMKCEEKDMKLMCDRSVFDIPTSNTVHASATLNTTTPVMDSIDNNMNNNIINDADDDMIRNTTTITPISINIMQSNEVTNGHISIIDELSTADDMITAEPTNRLINKRNSDSYDSGILSHKTIQSLLKSNWLQSVLKSKRLRDDILNIDSSQNRQG